MDTLWTQVTPSDFAWEQAALEFLRQALPDHEPFRAWANFEFIAQDGSMNEVDALILTPKGLFLVEIKSHPGEISGDAGQWTWTHEGRRRSMDNPRLLAERKAKKLASLLRSQRSARGSHSVPFVGVIVFLSAENVVNKLQGPARYQVCTRKNILRELKDIGSSWTHKRLDRPTAKAVSRAMEEAGIKESQRTRRVGPYQLDEVIDEADHFQDWLATHTEAGTRRRIRIYLTRGKPEDEANRLQSAAKLEFRVLEGVEHIGILRALDLQQHDQGPALVFDHDPAAQRLDLYLTERGDDRRLDPYSALSLLRQIAEAVRYAHGRKLYHRALSPQSIWVKEVGDGDFRVKIANWATADRSFESETQHLTVMSHLSQMVREEAGPYVALEAHANDQADAVYLDVFSLGAIAYLLFTGKPPAQNELELQDKLSRGKGLQVTDALNGAGQDLQDLIQYATHPDITNRYGSVDEFLEYLDVVEDEISRPDNQRQTSPTEAVPGDFFEGGIQVVKRLGRGASSVAFVVKHENQQRVLKLAVDQDHNKRLRGEGETLHKLRHQSIVAHHGTYEFAGHTGLIIDYANEGTLARRIREQGAVQMELLERFGSDLLGALEHLEDTGIAHRDIKPENIGLMKQGKKLHLVLFDFSLSTVGPDNITAGTVAYTDPFLRDPGRRRWDNYAERFSAALTLFEMTTGGLPQWATGDGLPPLIEGGLEIDASIFDPSVRESMAGFFNKALARNVKERFDNAEEMQNAWHGIFSRARQTTLHPDADDEHLACSIEDARLDTQIGLLPLSAAALDTLGRLNIHSVAELIKLPRNELVRMTGVGTNTRRELSELIDRLQQRFDVPAEASETEQTGGLLRSVDGLFAIILPKVTKATDPQRTAFLNEFLGRLDAEPPGGPNNVHWPNRVTLCSQTQIDRETAKTLQGKILTQWGKNKFLTHLRNELIEVLADNGGLMTATELAESILLRRGSSEPSPSRERRAQAVTRAAIETELAKQESRITLRRSGKRILIADNVDARGEELADYAEALGQLADEIAEAEPLLSPTAAIERIRALVAPDSFAGMSNLRLLRLAVAASQGAALSSRAELYPRGMPADRAIELGQGALLGSRALSVAEVKSRIEGRYPEAQSLPGRPELDDLITKLGLGFQWDGKYANKSGVKGAYCLPQPGEASYASRIHSAYFETQFGLDDPLAVQEVRQLVDAVETSIASVRFLALAVRPRQLLRARDNLLGSFDLRAISFDELLLRHLHRHCDGMAKPPRWDVVLKADAADTGSRDWANLQNLVRRVLPAMADEIRQADKPVLLTDPGLLARYDLINTWLSELRRQLLGGDAGHALVLLIANDVTTSAAVIDGHALPSGAGSREFARIPSAWLMSQAEKTEAAIRRASGTPS